MQYLSNYFVIGKLKTHLNESIRTYFAFLHSSFSKLSVMQHVQVKIGNCQLCLCKCFLNLVTCLNEQTLLHDCITNFYLLCIVYSECTSVRTGSGMFQFNLTGDGGRVSPISPCLKQWPSGWYPMVFSRSEQYSSMWPTMGASPLKRESV